MSEIESLYADAGHPNSTIGQMYSAAQTQANLAHTNPSYDAGVHSYALPFPNAPHDGGPQDIANRNATVGQEEQANNVQYQINNPTTWIDQLALMTNVGLATAGIGSGLGLGAAGLGAAAGGGTTGAIASGAAMGALGGGVSSALSGGNVAKKIGTGALLGGVGGGISSQMGGLKSTLTNAGVNPTVAGGLIKTGVGAATGALGGAISGQGALAGAEHGAISSGSNAITGSIFNSSSNPPVFSGGATDIQSSDPSLTNPTAPPMSDDGLDYIDPTGQYAYQNADGSVDGGGGGSYGGTATTGGIYGGDSNPGFTNIGVQGGGSTLGGGYTDAGGNTTLGNLTGSALAKFLQGMGVGTGGSGGGSGSGSGGAGGPLGALASLLTGGGGGGNGALLAQLLGLGASGIGGAMSSQAAKGAAGQFANQTKFNPFSVTTANGTNSFDGTHATSTPSAGTAQTLAGLQNLTNNSASALAAGPGADRTADFNALTSSQLAAQQRLMSGTQDNEFGNGILGSTAGQYQTQGALGAIGSQISGDQVTANNMANATQQQRLNDLTAGLSGTQQINASDLAALGLGGEFGKESSDANSTAYKPSLMANGNSNFGNIFSNMGGAAMGSGNQNNDALMAYLTAMMQGHG